MKELFLISAIIFALPSFAFAGQGGDDIIVNEYYDMAARSLNRYLYGHLPETADSLAIPSQSALRIVPNHAFKPGERFVFEIRYGILSGGIGIIEVDGTTSFRGTRCYKLITKAVTNKFVSTFYPVRDIFQSLVDTAGLYPVLFEKHLREGDYKNNYWILYDQQNQKAYWKDTVYTTNDYVQDIISVLFYLRNMKLEYKDVSVDVHTDRKTYPLLIKYHKRENVKVDAGKFSCIVVEPVFRTEGLFKKKGNLKVWLTDDERRMPVRMKSKIFFLGSITADLISYKPE